MATGNRKTNDLQAFTLETFFTPDPNAPNELRIDILSTLLARAQGIVLLLSSDAEARLEEGDTLHPIHIANALGAVWGLLNQAEAVILHSIIKPSGAGES